MSNDKTASIKWAIEELSKQKKEIESKVSVARKRDETSDLIKEVLAQRDALEKRISALEDGLKVSSDLVDKPVSELETEMSEIDGKLEIAQERLEHLEQEEYFEELGRKLSGKEEDSGNNEDFSQSDFIDYETSDTESQHDSESEIAENNLPTDEVSLSPSSPTELYGTQTKTQTATMKSTQSRIQASEVEDPQLENSRFPEAVETIASSESVDSTPKPNVDLDETASALGVESDFLAEKATQAVLRMIARNGGKLTFPLEVDQIA